MPVYLTMASWANGWVLGLSVLIVLAIGLWADTRPKGRT